MPFDTAIVLGSSIAGMAAARVLSERFQKIIVIERDALDAAAVPDAPATNPSPRRGVPQGHHAHALLARGGAELEGLFPGLLAACAEAGAVQGDIGSLVAFFQYGVWKARVTTGHRITLQSRPLLEEKIRRRVEALGNIVYASNERALSLSATADRRRITGVVTDAKTHTADLIVDASGRASHTPEWLAQLGFEAPARSELQVDIGYATRLLERGAFPEQGKGLMVLPMPPNEARFGVLLPIEGGRWICTLGGWHGEHPPTDHEGWLAFARSLPSDAIYQVVSACKPLSDVRAYRLPSSVRRHYESLRRRPERLVVVGDAACSFNPIYGQGMTVGVQEALELRACLRGATNLDGFAERFQRRVAEVIRLPWLMLASEDLRWPRSVGRRSLPLRLVGAYMEQVHRFAGAEPELARALYQTIHLVGSPGALVAPGLLLRVLRRAATSRKPGPAPRPQDPAPRVDGPLSRG